MKLRHNKLTSWVVNTIVIGAAGVFSGGILWQVLMPNVSAIAKILTVRIDGANSGSGTLIAELGGGGTAPRYRYLALTNWHVVSEHLRKPHSSFTLATSDGHQHRVLTKEIARVGKLDLAILEFRTHKRYPVATIGNSDRLTEGDTLYVSGWADPSPQLPSRTYQFLVGNLSGRIDRDRDGYSLVYTVNALPGMSGGPVFDRRGNLVGINGRATVDLRTGTVNSVLGIDINRYLRTSGNLR